MRLLTVKIDGSKKELIQQLLASLAEPSPEEEMLSSPTILAKEGYIAEAYMMGFRSACERFLDGADPVAIRAANHRLLMAPPTPSAATFAAGAIAATSLFEEMKEAMPARDGEYTIVDDEVKCVCGCGKSIKASANKDGIIQLELRDRTAVHGLMGLSPAGAKELAEQLLDARGCQ